MAEIKAGLIYTKIPKVMEKIRAISRDQTNVQQGFKYRGIDDVYNALQKIMAAEGVFTVGAVVGEKEVERKTQAGKFMQHRSAIMDWTFYAADGSFVKSRMLGEAMDTGDKAASKVISISHKYALLTVFMIPTEELEDPDAESHTVGDGKQAAGSQQRKADPKKGAKKEAEGLEFTEKQIDALVSEVEKKLKDSGIEYTDFKDLYVAFKAWLFSVQGRQKPIRRYVGQKFGNPSLKAGKGEDLQELIKNWDKVIEKFNNILIEMKAQDKEDTAKRAQDKEAIAKRAQADAEKSMKAKTGGKDED